MALEVVGASTSFHPSSSTNTYSNLPLPPGTQAGDILFFGGVAQNTFTVADSRLTRVADTHGDTINEGGIWTGVEDGTGNAIAVTMTDSASASNFMYCGLVVLRNTRVLNTHAVDNQPNPVDLPLIARPQAELAFVVSGYGVVDGGPTFPSDGVDWNEVMQAPDSSGKYHVRAMLRVSERSAVEQVGFTGSYMPERGAFALFGLTDRSIAPPCRLFPRGDGLGVGSGRHFPPAKSQQRSGRRFGYY